MKNPNCNETGGQISPQRKDEIVQIIRKSEDRSPSYLYHLIWINSNVTGLRVARATCLHLLSESSTWKILPSRIREKVRDDIVDFMSAGELPLQQKVDEEIVNHPTVKKYLLGTIPPESEQQLIMEEEERRQRQSDIQQLRIRTANEIKFVDENIKAREQSMWNDETPTMPQKEPLKLRPYSESFYRSYLGVEGEEDDIEFPEK